MGSVGGASAALSASLLTLAISACVRATDNMVSTTVPLLGTYVFGLGAVYGGIFTTIYSSSSLFSNWFVNPRLFGGGRRLAFVVALGAMMTSVFVMPFASASVVLALGVLVGVSVGILYPNLAAAAALYAETYHSERIISVYAVGLNVSLVLGPLLESYLLVFGYTAVFLVFSAVAALGFALSLRVRLSNVGRMPGRVSSMARRGLNQGILTGAVFFIPFGAIGVFLPIYARDAFGVSTAVAYSSYVPLYLVSLLVRLYMVGRPISSLERPIIASMAITAGGLIALFLAPAFPILVVVMALFGIPYGIIYTFSLLLVSRTSSEGERDATNSQLSAFYSVFGMSVPIATSAVSVVVGIREAFLLLLVPMAVASLLLLRSFHRGAPSPHLHGHVWAVGSPSKEERTPGTSGHIPGDDLQNDEAERTSRPAALDHEK